MVVALYNYFYNIIHVSKKILKMNRREFIKALMIGYMYNLIVPSNARSTDAFINYSLPKTGDIRLLHITDTHAQLEPIYFREPSVNLGVGSNKNIPPHLVSENFMIYYSINLSLIHI